MTQAATKRMFTVENMTRIAILAALGAVLFLVEIPIFPPIYKLDLSDIPALLGSFAMGPVPGLIVLLLKSASGLLHSSTGGVGELADFVMGAALILPAALIYYRNKTRKNALIGMLAGTVCMIVVSILANKYIMIPFFIGTREGMTVETIAGMFGLDSEWKLLLMITAPFNLIKGVVLSIVTALIYKPLSPILHGKKG